MAKKRHYDASRTKMLEGREYYAGEEARNTQQAQDGGMLREDASAIAHMPQSIIMKYYPKNHGYLPEDLDDTINGVDRLTGRNESKRQEHLKPKKT